MAEETPPGVVFDADAAEAIPERARDFIVMRETLVELLAEPGARKRAGRGAPDPLYEVSEAHV